MFNVSMCRHRGANRVYSSLFPSLPLPHSLAPCFLLYAVYDVLLLLAAARPRRHGHGGGTTQASENRCRPALQSRQALRRVEASLSRRARSFVPDTVRSMRSVRGACNGHIRVVS